VTLQIAFWLCTLGLLYIYLGYPLLVWLVGLCWRTRLDHEPWKKPISIVIVAHNEASRLREKLDSIFASDCADQVCEVIVGSDGSTDTTPFVVSEYPDHRVRMVQFEERRGRPACLNDLVPECLSDVVVLTDVRHQLEPTAIRRLLEPFADVRVAAVSGELVLRKSDKDTATARGRSAFWKYEKFLRRCESRFRSVPGAIGALYAVRKNVFRKIPENTILDDVVLPMQLVMRGYHCAFEPGAIVYEELSASPRHDAMRRRRMIAGCFQLMRNHPAWLMPHTNPIWWEFISHKMLRLASPLLLAGATAANVLLVNEPRYAVCLALQFAFYVTAGMGWYYQRRGQRSRVFGPSLTFVSMNLMTLAAWWDALRGRFSPTWPRAAA
jgi:cellulose synthase/poly-beta-1,6-N-acetylglucosamine synthase-like glycosyltransferase